MMEKTIVTGKCKGKDLTKAITEAFKEAIRLHKEKQQKGDK